MSCRLLASVVRHGHGLEAIPFILIEIMFKFHIIFVLLEEISYPFSFWGATYKGEFGVESACVPLVLCSGDVAVAIVFT